MKISEWFLIAFLIIFSLNETGCASFNKKLKSWLGHGNSNTAQEDKPSSKLTKFSDSPDISPRVRRQYKRTTRQSLADESALDDKAGSLWVMEGQGAYLFSQNVVRLIGDPLAVTLEGDPRDQLQSKVNVIKKLLAKIEERQRARLRAPTSEDTGTDQANADNANGDDKTAGNSKSKKGKNGQNQNQAQKPPEPEQELTVKTVPTRIVERTVEGNYRVKGSQPFMIGSREFKIIVTGVVRAEDFNEEGISATKLLDPKFDIVSARKTESQL